MRVCSLFMLLLSVALAPWLGYAAPITDVDPDALTTPGATPPTPAPGAAPEPAPAAAVPAEPPFTGVISAATVNARGGPSVNHFPLIRLKRDTEVDVVKEVFGWYQIKAPRGVFCWVHKDLVLLDAGGKAGAIRGENVNVRGDSILGHPPIRSDVVDQVSKGTRVIVVGTEGDFLRIEPTAGARVFVRADMVTPKGAGAVGPEPAAVTPAPPKPADVAAEAFKKAETALQEERLKAPSEWDLDGLDKLYGDAAEKAVTPRMKAVVKARLDYLARLRTLKATLDAVAQGRKQTEAELTAIEERRLAAEAAARAAAKETKPAFAVTGVLETLELTDGKRRFKLVDADDRQRILCVVEGDAAQLTPLVGRRVGINGTFKVSGQWPVKVVLVSAVSAINAGDGTRIARPPDPDLD